MCPIIIYKYCDMHIIDRQIYKISKSGKNDTWKIIENLYRSAVINFPMQENFNCLWIKSLKDYNVKAFGLDIPK